MATDKALAGAEHAGTVAGRRDVGRSSAAMAMLDRIGASWLQRGWLSANNIVFRGDDRAPGSVVDTGYVAHAAQTVALVRHALGDRPLGQVVNTHLHSDHCGGNAALARTWPDVEVIIPAGYRAATSPWNEAMLSYQHTGQSCTPFTPTRFLSPGDEVVLGGRRWQVHGVQGHDPDALIFFEPEERVLISGDALWEDRLAIIFPALKDNRSGFSEAHAALDLIESLKPLWVLPGHGGVFSDIPAAIARSRTRLDGFARDPERHRLHAARALAMYHMLERRQRPRDDLIGWMSTTPVFLQALACESDSASALAQATRVVDKLVADQALHLMPNGTVALPQDAS